MYIVAVSGSPWSRIGVESKISDKLYCVPASIANLTLVFDSNIDAALLAGFKIERLVVAAPVVKLELDKLTLDDPLFVRRRILGRHILGIRIPRSALVDDSNDAFDAFLDDAFAGWHPLLLLKSFKIAVVIMHCTANALQT